MTVTIRPFRPEDYAAMAVCNRAAMPENDDTAESLQEEDAHTIAMERWIAEVDGQAVGSTSWFQLANRLHPQKFWMEGAVHPDFQGRGIGSALLARVLEAIGPKHPISLRTFSREDFTATRRFLAQRGFVEAKRTWESFLDLAAFDFAPYAGQVDGVEAQGIRLCTLPELQGNPDWEQRLLDLYNTIQTDVPDIDQAVAVDMAYFQKNYTGSSSYLAEGNFIALDGQQWVGMTNLWKGGSPDLLNTGLTGTLPDYRRRGIALALKLRSLAWAREQGITRIRTTNASTNQGMLAINEQMGFVKRPAWLHLVRNW
jgi:mycothiol synthase